MSTRNRRARRPFRIESGAWMLFGLTPEDSFVYVIWSTQEDLVYNDVDNGNHCIETRIDPRIRRKIVEEFLKVRISVRNHCKIFLQLLCNCCRDELCRHVLMYTTVEGCQLQNLCI